MTKEQMIEKVETANEIYEKLKKFPVREREQIINMFHQFNQKDWDEYHKLMTPQQVCSNTSVPLV